MNRRPSSLVIFGIILGICIVAAAVVGAATFYAVRSSQDSTLSVTGSVRQQVTSDIVKWNAVFTRTVAVQDLKSGYSQMADDGDIVLNFLKEAGVESDEITVSPVFMEQPYLYDPNAPKEYILRQEVTILSRNVSKISNTAKNIQELIDTGIIFSTQRIEYYCSQLPQLRISMLSDAVEDAKLRAEEIARGTGRQVGSIKSASSGVVQVLPVFSTEVSDYGTYDTSTVEKEVMVTVSVVFRLK